MDRVPCFLLERTDRVRLSLRRFTYATRQPCMAAVSGGHHALVVVGEAPVVTDTLGQHIAPSLTDYLNDPRWPTACHACHKPFGVGVEYEVLAERIYRVVLAQPGAALEVGIETVVLDAPPGAMWRRPSTDRDLGERMYVVRSGPHETTELTTTDADRFFVRAGWTVPAAASA